MANKDRSEYNRQYYLDNQESEKRRKLEWYHANKDAIDREKRKEYNQQYYQNNKGKYKRKPENVEKINARKREMYANSPEMQALYREKSRRWQQENPQKRKAQRIKKYNLTIDEFNAFLESQNSACAICGYSDRSDAKFFPVVDHCHATGMVRGILCANCNHALGKFKDNPDLLRVAALYLEDRHAKLD